MATSKVVLNQQRHLLRQTESDLGRKVRGFAEVDKVLEGESKGNGFGEGEGDVLLGLLDIGMLADGHRAATDITLARELDAFFRSLDDNYPSQHAS